MGSPGRCAMFTHSLLDRLRSAIPRRYSGSAGLRLFHTPAARLGGDQRAGAHDRRFLTSSDLSARSSSVIHWAGRLRFRSRLNHPDQVGGLALLAPLTHAQERGAAVVPRARGRVAADAPFRRRGHRQFPCRSGIASFVLDRRSVRSRSSPTCAPRRRPVELTAAQLHRRFARLDGAHARHGADAGALSSASRFRSACCTEPTTAMLDPIKHGEAMAAKVAGLDLELIEGGGHMMLDFVCRSHGQPSSRAWPAGRCCRESPCSTRANLETAEP